MIIGTFIMTIVKVLLSILIAIVCAPLFLIKVSFFWFAVVFAASYIFFLVIHQSDLAFVRKDMALALAQSLGLGFFVACLIEAILQYWSFDVVNSAWFSWHQSWLQQIMAAMTTKEVMFCRISLIMTFLSGFFAAHFVGSMLDEWYEQCISERYGWMVVAVTLFCCAFLWFVIFAV